MRCETSEGAQVVKTSKMGRNGVENSNKSEKKKRDEKLAKRSKIEVEGNLRFIEQLRNTEMRVVCRNIEKWTKKGEKHDNRVRIICSKRFGMDF